MSAIERLRADLAARSLDPAEIQRIIDDNAPGQGEPWDMAAMLNEAYRAGFAAALAKAGP